MPESTSMPTRSNSSVILPGRTIWKTGRKSKTHREFLVQFFEGLVEEKLIQPTFIHDYPVENSPLAKRHRSKRDSLKGLNYSFTVWKWGTGSRSLNDPVDQKARFEDQDEKRRLGDVEAQMIHYDFINALGYGMPPTGGVGIGIDRLVMLLTNNVSIKEVILFPSMKKLQEEGDEPPVVDASEKK